MGLFSFFNRNKFDIEELRNIFTNDENKKNELVSKFKNSDALRTDRQLSSNVGNDDLFANLTGVIPVTEPSIIAYHLCITYLFMTLGEKRNDSSEGAMVFVIASLPLLVRDIAEENKNFPKEYFYGAFMMAFEEYSTVIDKCTEKQIHTYFMNNVLWYREKPVNAMGFISYVNKVAVFFKEREKMESLSGLKIPEHEEILKRFNFVLGAIAGENDDDLYTS